MTIRTSNYFKFLTSFVTISLLSLVYFSVNSYAEENSYTEEDSYAEENHTVIEINLDDNPSLNPFNNNLISPRSGGYMTIEVDKPIKEQGFINNATLKQMELRQRHSMNFLDILEGALMPTGSGVITAIAKAFNHGPTKLAEAAVNGDNAYVVTVYANGVAPSLSVITYIYYTKQSLRFVYQK